MTVVPREMLQQVTAQVGHTLRRTSISVSALSPTPVGERWCWFRDGEAAKQ